jgi:hypothetical protein
MAEDHSHITETVALSARKLLMADDTLSDPLFYETHIKNRSGFTNAIYYITRMKTHFILAEHEQALQMVRFPTC